KGEITFDPNTTKPGDKVTVTDKDGNPIKDSGGNDITDYELTPDDIANGIEVDVPVQPGDSNVELSVEVKEQAGKSSTGTDSNSVDNAIPTLSIELQAAGGDDTYNVAEINDGKVSAKLILDPSTVKVGDHLIVEAADGTVLLDRDIPQ